MRISTLTIASALAFGWAGPAEADIYKFVDEEGVVNYSDNPTDGRSTVYYRQRERTHARTSYARSGAGRPAPLAVKRDPEEFRSIVEEAAARYGLPASLLLAVIQVESAFQPLAVSPAGAEGLMQLMPSTARRLMVENSFDSRQNIMGGAAYLRQLLDLFSGAMDLALAAYNAGENRVLRNGQIPDIPETQDYVQRVMRWYAEFLRGSISRG